MINDCYKMSYLDVLQSHIIIILVYTGKYIRGDTLYKCNPTLGKWNFKNLIIPISKNKVYVEVP